MLLKILKCHHETPGKEVRHSKSALICQIISSCIFPSLPPCPQSPVGHLVAIPLLAAVAESPPQKPALFKTGFYMDSQVSLKSYPFADVDGKAPIRNGQARITTSSINEKGLSGFTERPLTVLTTLFN